jgi:DNA-binding MarR family transcriptional regulator
MPPDRPRSTSLQRFGLARDRLNAELSRRIGLSRSDLHALERLEASGPLTASELAAHLRLTSGATTTLIDRLEAAGWVERTVNPGDRRSVIVRLTDSATAAGRAFVGAYEREIRRAYERMSATERRTVDDFLGKVAHIADSHADRILGDPDSS